MIRILALLALLIAPASAQQTTAFPAASLPLSGSEVVYLVQSGVGKQTTIGNITGVPIVSFGTPASSSAACAQGQIMIDAAYIYTCVAASVWHRTSNGSTW